MDNGEVIIALNEDWTFAGANVTEWVSGFMMFIVCSELTGPVSRSMPLLLIIWVTTTFLLAAARKSFPDEERGLRNYLTTLLGFAPIGIPKPASLQPFWSGCPARELDPLCPLMKLGIYEALEHGNRNIEEKEAEVDLGNVVAGTGGSA